MIISRVHKYVFVEMPRPGSTAIARELLAQYDGERILGEHASHRDFLRIASEEEKRFFSFSGIRNPLDDAVSHYFKLKTDHHGRFSDPVRARYRVSVRSAEQFRRTGTDMHGRKPPRRSFSEGLENRRYRYVQRHNADFARFFLRHYWIPHDAKARLEHENLDFVIRFENMERDFAEALRRIGLEQRRPLPVVN